MHVVIINGSPRVQKYSNTEKIIAAFAKGLSEKECTFETYAISNRKTWDIIRDAYIKNDEILIALPLYVECVPGLLLEFLETLSSTATLILTLCVLIWCLFFLKTRTAISLTKVLNSTQMPNLWANMETSSTAPST